MEQLPLLLVIGLNDTWDTKVIHGIVCVSHTCSGSNKRFFPVRLCFHQRGIKPSISVKFLGTDKTIIYFDKQVYEDDVLFFCKKGLGHIEESSFSGKTHICAI